MRNSLPTIEEVFDIRTLSPSSITKWAGEFGDEGSWYLQYIMKRKFHGSPESIRGQVVEDAFEEMLWGKYEGNLERAQEKFLFKVDEAEKLGPEMDEAKMKKEYEALGGFIQQGKNAIEEMKLPKPFTSQSRVQVTLGNDIPLEVAGYLDFDFSTYTLDLKTTNRIPRKGVKGDHKMQISTYAKARNERVAKILYLSAKDFQAYSLVDREIDAGFNALRFKAKAITNRLETAILLADYRGTEPKKELEKLICPKFEGFTWKDEEMMFIKENNLWQIEDIVINYNVEEKIDAVEMFDSMTNNKTQERKEL